MDNTEIWVLADLPTQINAIALIIIALGFIIHNWKVEDVTWKGEYLDGNN